MHFASESSVSNRCVAGKEVSRFVNEEEAMRSDDFSLQALFAALDAQRRARGLSWAGVIADMRGHRERPRGRALSASTITGTRFRKVAEGDGVLQMLRWLGRTPESLMPGRQAGEQPGAPLPEVPAGKVLRFDTGKLYAAVNARRVERGLTWQQAAKEMRVEVSTLTHLRKGSRTAFPRVMRIVGWLRRPAAEFTRVSDQ